MKRFTKSEIISLGIIFSILIAVAVPNFMVSLRKARDQIRRDDMGSLDKAFFEYLADFGNLPPSSPDGHIMDCLKPGDKPVKDKKGLWTFNPIACVWGKSPFTNLITGSTYMVNLPEDPDTEKGVTYLYFSDGKRFQIYGAMEAKDEAEIDPKIVARKLSCGTRICNVGRSYNVPTDISIEEYDKQLLLQGKE